MNKEVVEELISNRLWWMKIHKLIRFFVRLPLIIITFPLLCIEWCLDKSLLVLSTLIYVLKVFYYRFENWLMKPIDDYLKQEWDEYHKKAEELDD